MASSGPRAFYLRSWYTQSIPPIYTFGWLPPVTISDGRYINGNVAVPAIYPGPLLIMPVARTITPAGSDKILAEAQRLGLLDGSSDFTGGTPMPGAKLVQIEIKANGQTYQLTGNPDSTIQCIKAPCEGAPGSPQAFSAFFQDLLSLDTWLSDELGPSAQYVPERVALILTKSADPQTLSPQPTLVAWPLATPPTDGCVTLTGDDLVIMLPVLTSATQLTAFSFGADVFMPTARVLVAGEPSPCDQMSTT
jgi:hypothetical protein